MYHEVIDLSHLPPEGLKLERRVNYSAWKITESDWASRGDLLFEVFLQGNPRKTYVEGKFSAGLTAECHRCLRDFDLDLNKTFRLTYLATDPDRFAREESELSSRELEVAYLETDYLELHEMVREQIYLALPMKFLCRADCRGLCVHCGGNLNEVECACSAEAEDFRLSKLRTIVNKSD
jgi:uncharacterized protein